MGGLLGIACIMAITPFIGFLAPTIGVEAAKILFIVIVVYAIVAFSTSLWRTLGGLIGLAVIGALY